MALHRHVTAKVDTRAVTVTQQGFCCTRIGHERWILHITELTKHSLMHKMDNVMSSTGVFLFLVNCMRPHILASRIRHNAPPLLVMTFQRVVLIIAFS